MLNIRIVLVAVVGNVSLARLFAVCAVVVEAAAVNVGNEG